jgi:hypothetical protein
VRSRYSSNAPSALREHHEGSWRPRRLGGSLLVLVLALATAGGCSTAKWTVKPHQRELLADRIMQLDGDAGEAASEAHVLSNREGAIGGTGTSGGGCGCN